MTRLHVTGTDAYGNPKSEIWSDDARPHPGADQCPSFCASGICMWNGKPRAMCPCHTRCRIGRVVIKGRIHEHDLPGHALDAASFDQLPYIRLPQDPK